MGKGAAGSSGGRLPSVGVLEGDVLAGGLLAEGSLVIFPVGGVHAGVTTMLSPSSGSELETSSVVASVVPPTSTARKVMRMNRGICMPQSFRMTVPAT
ncbi:hypothetical protein CVS29_12620 [Arthrobacter psychrochitiniphilus]|uniref:Uncharacterized protein n=1 Tax=Arthrobacter psychrochitiniphilus TaxID=291045 RepID=A0A2V3DR81_9MICC|nr:hypothetical protein CVS29_12620 [Arthrobacter psychrochitiniphilus]